MSISDWTRSTRSKPGNSAGLQAGTTNSTVLPIGGARDTAGTGADTCFAQVDAYWHALCDGRIMPDRTDVDPRGIGGVLDRTFLLERLAPGIARFRLAGMHLADLMGMEVRGMPASCFFLPSARAAFADAAEAVFSSPAKVDLWLTGQTRLIGKPMAARMLLLPLRDSDGAVTRALGCLSASRQVGGAPSRFNIVSDNRIALGAFPDRVGPARPTASERRKSSPHTPAYAAARPAFRVIQGGRAD